MACFSIAYNKLLAFAMLSVLLTAESNIAKVTALGLYRSTGTFAIGLISSTIIFV